MDSNIYRVVQEHSRMFVNSRPSAACEMACRFTALQSNRKILPKFSELRRNVFTPLCNGAQGW